MTFMRWFLILGLLFLGIRYLLGHPRRPGRRFTPPRGSNPDNGSGSAHLEEMVRDPVCGLYLPRSQALPGGRDPQGNTQFYCSEHCRRQHEGH